MRGKQAAWDVRAARKTADRRRFASKLSRGLKTIDRITLQETPRHDKTRQRPCRATFLWRRGLELAEDYPLF
jgi:hypothetical protein